VDGDGGYGSGWWGKEVVVENMEGIGGNGEKESRISSKGKINNAW